MATLDSTYKALIRQTIATKASVNYTRTHVDLAAQAIEDWLDDPSNQAEVSSAINSATGGNVFSASQKKQIFLSVCFRKFGREF